MSTKLKLPILSLVLNLELEVILSIKFYRIMEKTGLSPIDPSSFSRPDLAVVTDIFLNLVVNFEKKILSGHVILSASKVEPTVNELVLDAFKLNISGVTDSETKEKLNFKLSDHLHEFGSKLTIQLPKSEVSKIKICIEYETSPDASSLQWIAPEATAGKKHPFLFSQCEPTHARSFLPCQDTPSVKQTYKASITAPKELTSLMSAIQEDTKVFEDTKQAQFIQKVPVPSYLIALAVGALVSKKLGPRCQVWAENEIIEECAYEFADTEHQLKTAEEICGPYEWGIYDLLVLPPSFPYGGMENPCLTFVTPTLLAGDRSLANVVAHEIAHSWTGNLITNKSFEHFWLNEGFTVFTERKIKGRLESPQSQDFDAYTSISELKECIDRIGNDSPLTQLVVDLKGVHPDEAFSRVPYEKGQTFLRYLESIVGGPTVFEPFLRSYFQTFKYKSIDTDDFKRFFDNYFKDVSAIKSIDWKTWLYAPGMPPIIPDYDISLAVKCNELLDTFYKWNGEGAIPISIDDKDNLSTNQIIYCLQKLSGSEAQNIEKLKRLNELFKFDGVKNAEIKFRWLRICLKAQWEDKVEDALNWINVVGRMKYVRPLYRDLFEWQVTKNRVVDNFKSNRKNMMHVTAYVLAKDLKLEA
ncbi:unnamed protein product [Psylliodes chrysocephalus]|uniref:Peptidase M1 leukotriene A4 hydrolase/aminopeptidase C-terminal domain-containing protein n=1 Tax=Psylliodes chrysocephalus TaxID=3402493 RepID=A0A9P0GG77_9CUCU|nr:unnamed protein product [Psylliodes chrysocephala]